MEKQLENIINNSFDVTATTEGWADPEFFPDSTFSVFLTAGDRDVVTGKL